MRCNVCGDNSNDISRFRAPDLCNHCFSHKIKLEEKNAINDILPEEKLNDWRNSIISVDPLAYVNPPAYIKKDSNTNYHQPNQFAITDKLLSGCIMLVIGILILGLKIEITGILFQNSISLFSDNNGPKLFYIFLILVSCGLIISGIVNIFSYIKQIAIYTHLLRGK